MSACVEIDLTNLTEYPCVRKNVYDYNSSDRDHIWKAYLPKKKKKPLTTSYEEECTMFSKND